MKPSIPERPPQDSEFLFSAEWAFSPASSRQDILFISKDENKSYWLLWRGWFDDNYLQNVIECVDSIKIDDAPEILDASHLLVINYWNNETGLPEPEFITDAGLLEESNIDDIINSVWKDD